MKGLRLHLDDERLTRMQRAVATFVGIHRTAIPDLHPRPFSERRASMQKAVDTYKSLLDGLRLERPAEFSIFSLLRREDDELSHSRLLAWLLNPRGDHNQGTLFISAFASMIGLDAQPLSRCRSRRECVGMEAVIDIMLWREGDFLIFIENKVWSPEGEEQVDREFRDLRRSGEVLCVPENRQFAVFLTPSGRIPISGDPSNWTIISYRDLGDMFRAILPEVTDVKVRLLLEDWISVISDWG